MEITTKIDIDASPEKVWAILTDFANYSTWNPFIKKIAGNTAIGNQISVTIAPPEGKAMTFRPTVLAFTPNKEFRWVGRLLVKGLFDGEHKFQLINNGNGTTTFIQSENFKGMLVLFFKNQLENNTKRGFALMNASLKKRVEKML